MSVASERQQQANQITIQSECVNRKVEEEERNPTSSWPLIIFYIQTIKRKANGEENMTKKIPNKWVNKDNARQCQVENGE